MSAVWAPAAVSGPVRSVAFGSKPTSFVEMPASSRLVFSTLAPDVDARHLRVDHRCRLRVEMGLSERAPRAENGVVRPEEREAVLLRRIDRQERDTADDRLLAAERSVEGLVPDGDGPEQDDGDALVVRELLAAFRPVLLCRRGEALAEDERMPLDAAEVRVDVLRRELSALRPVGADEHLSALGVDDADHHRRELRVGLAGFTADVAEVVGNGSSRRHRARERREPRSRTLPRVFRGSSRDTQAAFALQTPCSFQPPSTISSSDRAELSLDLHPPAADALRARRTVPA